MKTNFTTLLGTLWGVTHPWVVELESFRKLYQAGLSRVRILPLHDEAMRGFIPCGIVRCIQTQFSTWVAAQEHSPTSLPVAPLATLWATMESGQPWMPTMPAQYMQRAMPRRAMPQPTPAGPAEAARSPAPSPAPAGPPTGGTQQGYISNTEYDSRFDEYRNAGLRTRDVRANATRPPPFCPGWHVRAGCNPNCRQAITHRRLTNVENEEMVGWCREFWRAPATGGE